MKHVQRKVESERDKALLHSPAGGVQQQRSTTATDRPATGVYCASIVCSQRAICRSNDVVVGLLVGWVGVQMDGFVVLPVDINMVGS